MRSIHIFHLSGPFVFPEPLQLQQKNITLTLVRKHDSFSRRRYLPNCRTNLVMALHECLCWKLFCHFINTTDYLLGWSKPSSPSTKELHAIEIKPWVAQMTVDKVQYSTIDQPKKIRKNNKKLWNVKLEIKDDFGKKKTRYRNSPTLRMVLNSAKSRVKFILFTKTT